MYVLAWFLVLDKEAINQLAELFTISLRSELTDAKQELGKDIHSELSNVRQELGNVKQVLGQDIQVLRGDLHNVRDELGKDLVNLWAKTHFTQTPTELGAHVKEWATPDASCTPQIVSPQLAEEV